MKNTNREVLHVAEIQEKLDIGRRQAYELVHSGEFPIVRIGRSIRIPREPFEEWLQGRRGS